MTDPQYDRRVLIQRLSCRTAYLSIATTSIRYAATIAINDNIRKELFDILDKIIDLTETNCSQLNFMVENGDEEGEE